MREDFDYLDSTKALWLEQGNPLWVWLAIKSSIHNEHPFPQWVCEYLDKIADRFLANDVQGGDFARKLPSILGFRAKRVRRNREFVREKREFRLMQRPW
jgi:hypothetical protein